MKSYPNASVMVVKVSRRPIYKVIRIEKKEVVIAFKSSRFSDLLRFKDICDELVGEVTPAWRSNGVICINVPLDALATNITHRFDEKNLNLIIAIWKKIDPEDQKSARAEESTEKNGEYIEAQTLTHIQEETTEKIHLPAEAAFLFRLLTVADNDVEPDAALFGDAAEACKKDQWEEGIKIISEFVEKYPESKYIEKAFFLLAECYRRLYSDNLSEHFTEVAKNYQNAIQKFPNSVHVPAATLMLANIYSKMKNYYEALAYYNILWRRYKDDEVTPEARFQIGKIYLRINKPEKAASAFQSLAEQYPQTFFGEKSKMEMAKALFNMNRFKKSLSLWTEISESNPVSVYNYPDILMYIGNNYYQLGQYRDARDTLLRAINLHHDVESNHLALARVADTYYELGAKESAYKFYDLVIREYPESDGALISSIRLAGRYQKGDDETILRIPKGGESHQPHLNPYELYEDIIKKYADNPMAQFVMLKIALLQQDDGEYEASINTIKEILKRYPETALEKDILQDSYKGLLKKESEKQNYIAVINYYERDKDILEISNSPEIFLIVGETCRELRLYNSASSMFQMADKFFLEENRPPELLFGLGESFFRAQDQKNAYKLFMDLVRKYPDHKDVPLAYYRIGQILLKEKKYNEAKKNLKIALPSYHKELARGDIVISIAEALKGMEQYKEAIKWLKEAVVLFTKQKSFEDLYDVYIELGELYIKIGDNINAAGILESALKLKEKDGETEQHGVMFRLAGCYQRLKKVEDSLDLLKKISVYQDTLWGKMATEKIKEIDIRRKIRKIGKLRS